jgi:transcriptional regulator with XRE-family HTH domain
MQLSDQLREAIKDTQKPVYVVAKESGVAQAILSRFMAGKRGLRLETAEKLLKYLKMEIRSERDVRCGI